MIDFLSSAIVWLRNFSLVFLILVAVISGINFYFQTESRRQNVSADLSGRPLKGSNILTEPKMLSVGQKISAKEIINYLKEVGFGEITQSPTTGELPVGCFLFIAEKKQLRLRSAIDDHLYPPLIIEWNGKNEIVRLVSSESETLSAQIEGYHFNNRVYETKEENEQSKLKNFVVIRIPTRGFILQGKNIYYVTQGSEGAFDLAVSPRNLIGSVYRNYVESPFKKWLGYDTGNDTGGSTPAMQLCRSAILLDKRDTLVRKLREVYCASDLSSRLTEPQLAESYFNHVYYGFWRGEHLYGVETAARKIFGKSAADLGLYEAAWLCALAPTPERLKKLAVGDRKTIAKHQTRVEAILDRTLARFPEQFTAEQIAEAKTKTPKFSAVKTVSRQTRLDRVAKPFMQMAFREFPPLRENIDLDTLTVSAARLSDAVYTTRLDADLMFAAERILQKRLKTINVAFPPIDENGKRVNDALVGVVSLADPKTGEIIALVIAATDPKREISALYANALIDPGSQKKVFDLTAALESGLITPATVIDPSKGRVIERCNGKEWQPNIGVGGVKTAADVLSLSDDGGIVYIVGNLLGLDESVAFYERITGSSVEPLKTNSECRQYASVNAIGFGKMGASPLRLGEGFSTFANGGWKSKNRFLSIAHFEENSESPPVLPATVPEPVISPQTAYQMMWMMRRVLTSGTAAKLPFSEYLRKHPEIMVGCKTGSGAMAVGFSCAAPNFVASVQIFYADGSRFRQSDKNRIFAADTSARIFSDLMMEALKIKPALFKGEIPRPEGIVEVKVDLQRGCRDDSGVSVPFRAGTELKLCSEETTESPSRPKVYIVDTGDKSNLNLRVNKDLNSGSAGVAPQGAEVNVLFCETEKVVVNGRRGSWCRVRYGADEGWAWGWFIRAPRE